VTKGVPTVDESERRRRIDRVTADDYLHGLADRSMDELRTMRDDCREEESRLSYSRRLVQGQLDILRAERRRREGGGEGGLVASLTEILSDAPAARAPQADARSTPVFMPPDETYGAREHDVSVEDAGVARMLDLDGAGLDDLEQRLVAKERHVSELRRTVLDRLDALSDELVRRYREGAADVNDIVSNVVGQGLQPE
jgi:hypothetical protein